ncbi:nitroreductase family protein [Butyrivibrio sp. LC3010]|uniref:nitroreductase family protein n=1 Tax=Butyrivibrio sp. LC3010 TaxID=1280680 RepID=UPI0009DC2331
MEYNHCFDKDEAPDKKIIEKIIEAGRFASSGSNSQSSHFLVITDKEFLKELS